MESVTAPGDVRIGELSRRVGVSDHLLRAWEQRYGLLVPSRSAGGFRLYSAADEARVRRMQSHMARGLSAAEAARAAIAGNNDVVATAAAAEPTGGPSSRILDDLRNGLQRALDSCDEVAAQQVLDRLLAELTLTTALRDVLLPYLRELGARWDRGDVSIAQEHFASNVLRGRLAGLARGWGSGRGPRAVLACPPGELHDLPLLIFGIVLNRNGWTIDYFGASTPIAEVIRVVAQSRPDLVVLAAASSERFTSVRTELAGLAQVCPLALAGAGATRRRTEQIGARLLVGDPVTAAENEAKLFGAGGDGQ